VREFNLIATCPRGAELSAIYDLRALLEELGDEEADAWESGVSGLILAKTSLDPIEVVERARALVRREPWKAGALKRLIPIQRSVAASVDEIVAAAAELAHLIEEGEKFRVTVEKRHTQLSSREIIFKVAELFDQKVDLEKPDKVVLVEVVGPVAGVSVIKPSQLVSLEKEKLQPQNE